MHGRCSATKLLFKWLERIVAHAGKIDLVQDFGLGLRSYPSECRPRNGSAQLLSEGVGMHRVALVDDDLHRDLQLLAVREASDGDTRWHSCKNSGSLASARPMKLPQQRIGGGRRGRTQFREFGCLLETPGRLTGGKLLQQACCDRKPAKIRREGRSSQAG